MGNPPRRHEVEKGAEAELIDRARNGDRAAFAALVRAHQDEVYTLARRLVGDPHLASDVAQETLIRAWRALPNFRGEAKLSTWLHRITVNTAWSHRQRARRHSGPSIDDLHDLAAPEGIDHPVFAGEVLDLRRRLKAALARLPAAQRQVVILKDVYGWTHHEIARSMGISVTAAKVRLHRARARLARDLDRTS
jgi:RNA polymerase sigma-70 factor (ECF subfamily)